MRIALALFTVSALVAATGCRHSTISDNYPKPPVAFDGDSRSLKETIVVPTLDSPIPPGKNVIWCSSFETAWTRLRDDVARGDLDVIGAEEVCAKLNRIRKPENDLPDESYYASAGLVRDGIVPKIQEEMKRRFPSVPAPTFDGGGGAAVAYAYLAAHAAFTSPFNENTQPLEFKSAKGITVAVGSFGIRHEDQATRQDLRDQVTVLYTNPPVFLGGGRSDEDEFAIDPCRSTDVQVVAARGKPASTLAQTLTGLEKKITDFQSQGFAGKFGINDTLLIPNLNWKISHRFRELEGKNVRQFGGPIVQAEQMIAFRLDRSGAEVRSESKLGVAAAPADYIFDRPFLFYMKKRGGKNPFFVMWIQNAELLSKLR